MAAVFLPEPVFLRGAFVASPRAVFSEDAHRRAKWRSADMLLCSGAACSDDRIGADLVETCAIFRADRIYACLLIREIRMN